MVYCCIPTISQAGPMLFTIVRMTAICCLRCEGAQFHIGAWRTSREKWSNYMKLWFIAKLTSYSRPKKNTLHQILGLHVPGSKPDLPRRGCRFLAVYHSVEGS